MRAESSTAVSALSVLPCALVPSRVRCGLATRLMRSWRACLSRPSVAAPAPMPQRRGSSSSLGPTLARARAVGPSCGTPQLHATWRSCARAWSRAILPTGARASGSSTMSSRELPRGTGRASQASGRRPASLAPRCAGAGLAAPFARTTARLRAQVSLALRVAQRAAGGLAAPQTPMAMPGSAAVDGELSEAMRDYVRLQTAALERDKKDKKLSFCLQAPCARHRESRAAKCHGRSAWRRKAWAIFLRRASPRRKRCTASRRGACPASRMSGGGPRGSRAWQGRPGTVAARGSGPPTGRTCRSTLSRHGPSISSGGPGEGCAVRARARQVAGARSRSARGIWGFESENPRILDR